VDRISSPVAPSVSTKRGSQFQVRQLSGWQVLFQNYASTITISISSRTPPIVGFF